MMQKKLHTIALMLAVLLLYQSYSQSKGYTSLQLPILDQFPKYGKSDKHFTQEAESQTIKQYQHFFDSLVQKISFKIELGNNKHTHNRFTQEPLSYFADEIRKMVIISENSVESYSKDTKVGRIRVLLAKLYQRKKKTRLASSDIAETNNLITQLPDDLSKLQLLYEFSSYAIFTETYYDDIKKYSSRFTSIISKLPTLKEKGYAYEIYGNFFAHFQLYDSAIYYLYKSIKCINKLELPTKRKNVTLDRLNQNISNIFNIDDVAFGVTKSVRYVNNSFSSLTIDENCKSIELVLPTLADLVFKMRSIRINELDSQQLNGIKYICFSIKTAYLQVCSYSAKSEYFLYYSMGILEWKLNSVQNACEYFWYALINAIHARQYRYIKASISWLSYIYASQNNKFMSDGYGKLLELMEGQSDYNKEIMTENRAQALHLTGNFKSAYATLDSLENDTAYINYFYPPNRSSIYERIYKAKSEVAFSFDSLLAFKYDSYYLQMLIRKYELFINMQEAEAKGITEWLKDIATSELSLRENLISEKERTNELLTSKYKLVDSLNTFNKTLAILRKDSLTNAIISKLKDSIYYTDSLIRINTIQTLERENNEKEKKIADAKIENRNNTIWAISASSLLIISVLTILYKHRQNKKKKEIERINTLTRNNIHNFKNDYMVFGNLIADADLQRLDEFNERYGEYLKQTHRNWQSPVISLESEIHAGECYAMAKQVRDSNVTITISTEDLDTANIRFLPSIFDTVFHNSFKHGFKHSTGSEAIIVTIEKQGKYLVCTIADTGVPPKSDEVYFKEKERGLSLLKARIWHMHKRRPPQDFFTASKRVGTNGTIITFKIPYEEI